MRVDQSKRVNVLSGCSGELLRIDSNGNPLHEPVTPFPANISGGVVIGESWIGTWVDQELREARMAALSLDGKWEDGGSRQHLREVSDAEVLMPASSTWSRRLDAEPMALTRVTKGAVFATLNRGVYMINEFAEELWRAPYPEWLGRQKFQYSDTLVSCTECADGISLWSRSGAVTLLDAEDGSFISSHVVPLTGPLAGVKYSEVGGSFLMLENGDVGLLDNLHSIPQLVKTPGPVFDTRFSDGGWHWTGWRHDGFGDAWKSQIVQRRDVGIALLGDSVITNDGRLDLFRAQSL
tara:strand:+ start:6033 stop:6914 length:882 start_codon:yes stop_codon:yes gene_type:complete